MSFPPADWEPAEVSRLWRYHLHYFDWVWAFRGDPAQGITAVEAWMEAHPWTRQATGWEPYPTSLRVMNWLLLCAGPWHDYLDSRPEIGENILASLITQVNWLERRLEVHLLANHLLENVAALVLAGELIEGHEAAERWRTKGQAWLRREIKEQILGDGCHFERSPMYHQRILWLMETIAAVSADETRAIAKAPLKRMRCALAKMAHPDGDIALVNDAAQNVYLPKPDLKLVKDGAWRLEEAGYCGWRDGLGNYLIVDVGPVGPDYQPGHAHADYLSFELSLDGRRFITDTGIFNYVPGHERRWDRSTAAHNTVTVNQVDSCEVWSAFRVGRRVRPRVSTWAPRPNGFDLEAWHDGYAHLPQKVRHLRHMKWSERGLEVADRLEGRRSYVARGHLHFAPDVDLSVEANDVLARSGDTEVKITFAGEPSLEAIRTPYSPEFGIRAGRACLVYTLEGRESRECRLTFQWTGRRSSP